MPSIRSGGEELEREACLFDYVKVDLTLFVPGISGPSPRDVMGPKTVGYLMLDAVVGAYDVETWIGGIEFVDVSDSPERRRIPLRALASIVDALPRTVQ